MAIKKGEKHFEITLERFSELQNQANSIKELRDLLQKELGRSISQATCYYKMKICQKNGLKVKRYAQTSSNINVEELNNHHTIKLIRPSPPQSNNNFVSV